MARGGREFSRKRTNDAFRARAVEIGLSGLHRCWWAPSVRLWSCTAVRCTDDTLWSLPPIFYNSDALFLRRISCWLREPSFPALVVYLPVNHPSSQKSAPSAPALPRKLPWLAYSPSALPPPLPADSLRSLLLSRFLPLSLSLSLRFRWKGRTPRKPRSLRSLPEASL